MKKWQIGILAMLLSGLAGAAQLPVVASFSIVGDVAKQIGGDKVAVTELVGADQDAHAYHLTSGDVKKIKQAKLVLMNGLGLEGAELQRVVKQSGVRFAEAAVAGIQPLKAEEEHEHHHDHGGHDHHDHGEFDPHVWQDPVLMQHYAANVAKALIAADPSNKNYYAKQWRNYSNQLKALNQYAEQTFRAIPMEKRKVLTGHDAFAYMGKRYKIQFIAPQGVSSEAQPSARQVAGIIRQVKREGIKAIFAENIKDARMVERIARETGGKIGGKLYSDALSKGAPARTYIDMYRYNVRVLGDAMK